MILFVNFIILLSLFQIIVVSKFKKFKETNNVSQNVFQSILGVYGFTINIIVLIIILLYYFFRRKSLFQDTKIIYIYICFIRDLFTSAKRKGTKI